LPVLSVKAMRSCVLRLAAEGEEGFALEVQHVLLADQGSGRDAAAGENVRRPAGDLLVVLGGVAGLAHEKDAGFERGQAAVPGAGICVRGCGAV
jgi:hypothetical protein